MSTPPAARWSAGSRRRLAALRRAAAAHGGASTTLDVRALCLLRETLARSQTASPISPSPCRAWAPAPISLFGTDAQQARAICRAVAPATRIAAFALSEPEAGSDVAAMATHGRARDGDDYVLDGEKTWISNGGIADFYVVFARTGEAPGATRSRRAFVVEPTRPASTIAERIEVIAPHPLGHAALRRTAACRPTALIGAPGEGFKVAMATLDMFRPTVGAAALGFARRALDEALARATSRSDVRRARWPSFS